MSEEKTGLSSAIETVGAGEPPTDESEQLALLPLSAPGTDVQATGRDKLVAQKRKGPGRPAGSRNKRTKEWQEFILKQHRSPLEVLASVYSRPLEDLAKELGCKNLEAFKLQLQAARELAPYVHQKQPQAIQMEGSGAVALQLVASPEIAKMIADADREDEEEGYCFDGTVIDHDDMESE